MQILWQQGRIAWNLGLSRHGPRLLVKARKGLAALGGWVEFALISLDLAGFYLEHGETEAYDTLVADTLSALKQHKDPQLHTALASWTRSSDRYSSV